MSIEDSIFKKCTVNMNKLEDYGFVKNKTCFIYEKFFLNNSFKAVVTIDSNKVVDGKVIDLDFSEEYTNIRTDMSGKYVSKVKEEYINILLDIKEKCFNQRNFIFDQSNRISNYIYSKYNVIPEFLWANDDNSGVFRKNESKKWFGIIMDIDYSKIATKTGEVEVINLKLNRDEIQNLLKENGFYEAYHMNKKDWISIALNETIDDNIIFSLIDKSYNLVK